MADKESEKMKNYGVILGQRDTDFVGGTLPYEVLVSDGNWKPYLPSGERQHSRFADSMGCVSFSALNCVEAQIKRLTGKQTNYSDRWLAKMSETTPKGNYLYKVADTLRLKGSVPEIVWSAPAGFTWDTYYADIPQDIQDMGKEFLEEFDIRYEWIDVNKESFLKHLKHAPLQVIFPNHAVMAFFQEEDVTHYFDSYEPYEKTANNITHALKIVVTTKNNNMTEEEVKHLYALAFYREPLKDELDYWVDKPLSEFLKVAIGDRAEFLKNQLL